MADKTSQQEEERRLAAFEATKKQRKGGSVKLASKLLGDITPNALSRWLNNRHVMTDRQPELSKDECIAGLRTHLARHKSVSRDRFASHSAVGVKWKTHWPTWQEFTAAAGVLNDPAKILLLDIETAPMIAMVWGTRKQYINHEWIAENGYIMCWTAKWLNSKEQIFRKFTKGKPLDLLKPIHDLLNEAQVVVHYNGKKFDVPTLNREFLLHGLPPPKPFKQVDCLLTMWEKFAFPVNKLDYIAKILKVGQKIANEGAPFWRSCMADEPEAWKKMEAYNRHDVVLLEGVYKRILPWISKHPNVAALTGTPVCPTCGSDDYERDGTYTAAQLQYEQYKCGACKVTFRGTKSISLRKGQRFALTA